MVALSTEEHGLLITMFMGLRSPDADFESDAEPETDEADSDE